MADLLGGFSHPTKNIRVAPTKHPKSDLKSTREVAPWSVNPTHVPLALVLQIQRGFGQLVVARHKNLERLLAAGESKGLRKGSLTNTSSKFRNQTFD